MTWRTSLAAGVFLAGLASPTTAARLEQLLGATPQGGWINVNLNTFASAWATGSTAVNVPSYDNPAAIVYSWSSMAWDSSRGTLMLWGGGHANYAGNEMYLWNGETGLWSRGSLPSRLDSEYFVVDGAAPQSAHTYDNNLYVRNNDMFVTLGGAAFGSGGNFANKVDGLVTRSGPWLWDPTKANANLVGGTSGSGYDASSPGGSMWINRAGQWTGSQGPSYVDGTTAYRNEGGKDVIYMTSDNFSSGFPLLYRYTLGDVRSGGKDSWEAIGRMWNSYGFQGTSAIDNSNNLFIRTVAGGGNFDFAVFDLNKASPGNPNDNRDIPVSLKFADGTDFVMNKDLAVEYDPVNGQLVMWDGRLGGTVFYTKAEFDGTGVLKSTWQVRALGSTTASQPTGSFVTGVLGKWQYAPELGAFVALDEWRNGDASVWLYKPAGSITLVPEPQSWLMLGLGLLAIGAVKRRQGSRLL